LITGYTNVFKILRADSCYFFESQEVMIQEKLCVRGNISAERGCRLNARGHAEICG